MQGSIRAESTTAAPYQRSAADKPSNPSCFGTIGARADELSRLADGAEMLADRLLGGEPRPVTDKDAQFTEGGLFGDVYKAAHSIESSTIRIKTALERIEKSLP